MAMDQAALLSTNVHSYPGIMSPALTIGYISYGSPYLEAPSPCPPQCGVTPQFSTQLPTSLSTSNMLPAAVCL